MKAIGIAFFGLIVIGAAAKFWWLILLAVALTVGVYAVGEVAERRTRALEDEQREAVKLVARADREHDQYLQGDMAGVYGQYPPAA